MDKVIAHISVTLYFNYMHTAVYLPKNKSIFMS